jgi:GT2 family glycosyltransferase
MSTNCEITGIVVNYNSMKYIDVVERSIKSLINISDKPIIFVDNGSSDGSYEYIIKKFGEEILSLPLTKNFGYAGAVDLAFIKFSNYLSDIFFISNNDLIVTNNEIVKKLCKIMIQNRNIATSGGILVGTNGRVQTAGFMIDVIGFIHNLCEDVKLNECEHKTSIADVSFISGSFTLFKKKYIQILPDKMVFPLYGFMYLDDIVTGLYYSQLGFKNIIIHEPLGIHFESLSMSSSRKAFLLGRALAIQRRIIKSPLQKFSSLYERTIELKLKFQDKNLVRSFRQGWISGKKEYEIRKTYWDKYQINVNKVRRYNSINKAIKRILRFSYMR